MPATDIIEERTAGEAWRAAVRALLIEPTHRVSNLVVRISEPHVLDDAVGAQLDVALGSIDSARVRAVARTIIPGAVTTATSWEKAAARLRPKLPPDSYFRRMIDYVDDGGSVNQIRNVIGALNHRTPCGGRWADPGPLVLERPAHSSIARVGFPCLSQIQFHRSGIRLVATAVYRSHYYHSKAYGNFVGLSRLQCLVARECGLDVGELVVISTDARLEKIGVMQRLIPI